HSGSRYPSLAHWLARRRQFRESLAEELRLLYVALTRARDTLILSGSISASRFQKRWVQGLDDGSNPLFSARSCADWLGAWFAKKAGGGAAAVRSGEAALLRWRIYDEAAQAGSDEQPKPFEPVKLPVASPETWHALQERLSWNYPWLPATKQPAKT